MTRFCRNYVFLFFLLWVPSLLWSQQTKKDFTIAEIYSSQKFSGKTLRGVHWMKDEKRFIYQETYPATRTINFISYDIASGKRETFIDAKN